MSRHAQWPGGTRSRLGHPVSSFSDEQPKKPFEHAAGSPALRACCPLVTLAMYNHDDPITRPFRPTPGASIAKDSQLVAPDRRAPLTVVIVVILGLAVTSGCALAPAASPAAVVTCAVPAPSAPPPAPPPATTPAVSRAVARPVYVRPVVPPLPTDVYQPSAQGAASSKAQRRVAVPAHAAESGKSKDDAKS